MKIAIVSPYFAPIVGGIETYVHELARRVSQEHDVEVYTCGQSGVMKEGNVAIHRLRAIDIKDLPFRLDIPYPIPPTLPFRLVKSGADIIHVHGHAFATTFGGALSTRILHKPLVITVHDLGIAYIDYRLIRGIRPLIDSIPVQTAINWSDVVIVQNKVTLEYVSKFHPSRIVMIPQAVDTDIFKPADREGRYITFIAARLVSLKGDEVFLRAIPGIVRALPEARFRVVGGGARRQYLERLAAEINVKDRIEFTGSIPHEEVPKYLAEASVVVCPGVAGLLLLEAAAMRKIIVTARHDWGVEALGETAMYFPPNSPAKLAELVVSALKSPELRGTLAEAAYQKVVSERSWDTVAELHARLYDAICRGGLDELPRTMSCVKRASKSSLANFLTLGNEWVGGKP